MFLISTILWDNDGVLVDNSELTIEPSKPRSYAFCSDTAYYERIAKAVIRIEIINDNYHLP